MEDAGITSLAADLNARADGLFKAAPGSVLLHNGSGYVDRLGPRFLLVVAWTTANRAVCEDFAKRLHQRLLRECYWMA